MDDVNSTNPATLLALLIGVILALALIRFARARKPEDARRIYAIGLLVTALLYVALAVVGGASREWLALESVGVVLYGGAAWIGWRYWPGALAVGWAAHVAWDVLLHLGGPGGAYTPDAYPWFCVSFDLIVAIAVLLPQRRDTL